MASLSFLHRLCPYLLPAGMVFCLWRSFPVSPAIADGAAGAGAVISEVMWMGSDVSTADEWVELACPAVTDCALSGWSLTTLKSSGEEGVIITFATGAILPAGDVAIVSKYPASSSRLLEEPWLVTSTMSLPNTKLLLRLRDLSGAVRDEADDGVGNPFAGANPSGGPKASMERIDLSAAGNVAANWRTATASLGFDEGPPIFGTPGILPDDRSHGGLLSSSSASSASSPSLISSFSSISSLSSLVSSSSQVSSTSEASSISSQLEDLLLSSSFSSAFSASSSSSLSSISSSMPSPTVLITEVLANPVGADTHEWIEIGNLGDAPVDIAGWVLDDGNSPGSYRIPPRSGSGFVLSSGEHVSFPKSVTGLPLDNSGERVSLMSGALLVDAWEYPLTAEEVSYGREPDPPYALRAFCVPTEGRPNAALPLAPRIVIQSAGSAQVGGSAVVGEERVSLNLQAAVGEGSLASAVCAWDFDDDAVSAVCNPPSHAFDMPSQYTVRLTVRDFCGSLAVSTLSVTVLPKSQSSSSSSVSPVSFASSRSSSSSAASVSSASSSLSVIRVETGVVLSEVLMTGDEWIELYNPTGHEISLDGWILDDLKDGGSKPFLIPSGTVIAAGAYRIFQKSETKLALNDGGDDVWLIAPDDSWSGHITVPKLKAGISFSFCDGEWRSSDPTPELPNTCQTIMPSVSSASSVKKSAVVSTPAFSRTRYVAAFQSSVSSLSSRSFSSFSSGSLLMTYAGPELPEMLTVAGSAEKPSALPEVGTLGAVSGVGVVLIFLGRKWWFL